MRDVQYASFSGTAAWDVFLPTGKREVLCEVPVPDAYRDSSCAAPLRFRMLSLV